MQQIYLEDQMQKSFKDFRIAGDLSILSSVSAAIGLIMLCLGMIDFLTGNHIYQMASKIGLLGLLVAALFSAAAGWKTRTATDRLETIRRLIGEQF